MTPYKPIAPQQLPKFAGIKTYMPLPHSRTTLGIDIAIVGVSWDGATSYRTGQRSGPDAIRKVSVTLRPYNQVLDAQIFEHCSGVKVLPDYDVAEITALMAASIICEFLSLIALNKRRNL
ncbi:MAG: arginase family protein [Desulfobacterales bacterium]|jgi:agmatinase